MRICIVFLGGYCIIVDFWRAILKTFFNHQTLLWSSSTTAMKVLSKRIGPFEQTADLTNRLQGLTIVNQQTWSLNRETLGINVNDIHQQKTGLLFINEFWTCCQPEEPPAILELLFWSFCQAITALGWCSTETVELRKQLMAHNLSGFPSGTLWKTIFIMN